jgi:hypothetical protein
MSGNIHLDMAASQAAQQQSLANNEDQRGGQGQILGTNEGTEAGWHGPTSRAFGTTFRNTDGEMTVTGTRHLETVEGHGQVNVRYQANEEMQASFFNAINTGNHS